MEVSYFVPSYSINALYFHTEIENRNIKIDNNFQCRYDTSAVILYVYCSCTRACSSVLPVQYLRTTYLRTTYLRKAQYFGNRQTSYHIVATKVRSKISNNLPSKVLSYFRRIYYLRSQQCCPVQYVYITLVPSKVRKYLRRQGPTKVLPEIDTSYFRTKVLSYYRTKVLSQVQYLASYHKYLRRYCITTRTTRKIHTVREHTVGPTISHYFRERMPLS